MARQFVVEEFYFVCYHLSVWFVFLSGFVYQSLPLLFITPFKLKRSITLMKQMLSHSTYPYSNQYDWHEYLDSHDHHESLQLKGYRDFFKDSMPSGIN